MQQLLVVLRALLGPVLLVGVVIGLQSIVRGRLPDVLGVALIVVAVLATYVLHNRYIERRAPVELAPRRLLGFLWGALLGFGLFGATMALLALCGAYHLLGWSMKNVDLPLSIALVLFSGVWEEMLFRGYAFRFLAGWRLWPTGTGGWIAIALTSLFFGLAHAFNPHATIVSSIAIALEAGVLLGAAYWVSGNLWFPIGLHAGWNFTEGTIFDTPISGGSTPGVFIGSLQGPEWLTGGAFGVESSLIAVLVCGCAASVMLVAVARRRIAPVR